ncbi:MAG: phage virion morphogenesis protein [Panacagrimonas sp.]
MRIDLQVDSAKAETLLKRLEQAGINPLPVMLQIGKHLVETTKERFRTSRAPDGSPWAPNKLTTIQQFGARKGAFGTTRRGAPIPWGDIPARPFLGISDEDRTEIELLLFEFLEDQTGS